LRRPPCEAATGAGRRRGERTVSRNTGVTFRMTVRAGARDVGVTFVQDQRGLYRKLAPGVSQSRACTIGPGTMLIR